MKKHVRNGKAEIAKRLDFLDKIHPERGIIGSTKHDGTLKFYSAIKTIMREIDAKVVMDFGAGRGAQLEQEKRLWRRELMDLRQYNAKVYACDIDPAVKEHRWSDHQVVLDAGRIPFDNEFFDMIVSDVTFEHVEDSRHVSSELMRVLCTGGILCVRTPNAFGYPKLFTSLVPNRFHSKAVKRVQPGGRQERDVFPTAFKMNSVKEIRNLFPKSDIYWYYDSAEPSYYFGNQVIYRAFMFLHKVLPDFMGTSLCLFIRKR